MSGGEEDLMQTDQITEVVDFFQPLFLVDQVLAIGNKMKRATKEASRQWPMHAEIYIMSSPKFPRFNAISESMTPCLTAFARTYSNTVGREDANGNISIELALAS